MPVPQPRSSIYIVVLVGEDVSGMESRLYLGVWSCRAQVIQVNDMLAAKLVVPRDEKEFVHGIQPVHLNLFSHPALVGVVDRANRAVKVEVPRLLETYIGFYARWNTRGHVPHISHDRDNSPLGR